MDYLDKGRTFNVHYDGAPCRLPKHPFPCLSAALFSRNLVQSVWDRYGNFVCDWLGHYGDCTDVALRAAHVGKAIFASTPKAVALKRWPTIVPDKAAVSQLVAATRYYSGKGAAAIGRIREKEGDDFAKRVGERYLEHSETQYSPHTNEAPPALIDDADDWRSSAAAL